MKKVFITMLAVLCLLGFCVACAPQKGENPSAPAGPEQPSSSAPVIFFDAPAEFEAVAFATTDLQGNAQSQQIFADHDLTLVNIWATWCSPCIDEMPVLEKIYQEGEIGVVGIVIESRDDDIADFASGIAKKTGATFPILRVTEEMEKGFLSEISSMPTTFCLLYTSDAADE